MQILEPYDVQQFYHSTVWKHRSNNFTQRGRWERNVSVRLLIVPCKNVFNSILGRPFLAVWRSSLPDPLKMKYHNNFTKSVTVVADLYGAYCIQEAILKSLSITLATPGKVRGEVSVADFDVQEDEVL